MALLYPSFPKSVVAIGTKQGKNFVADSTGFIIKIRTSESDKKAVLPENFPEGIPEVFIVTNRHVFDGRDEVIVRFNDKQQVPFQLKSSEGIGWTNHKDENVDIAVAFIPNLKYLDRSAVVAVDEDYIATSKVMEREGVSIGDEVYALGFPLRLAGEERNYPIVRSGIIARLDDEILKNHYYYVDVAIYPGNSGGPVILKPATSNLPGTSKITKPYLIGVVASVELQSETLYGENGAARMILYEHANLGRIFPMECVMETVDYLKRRIDQRVPGTAEYNP